MSEPSVMAGSTGKSVFDSRWCYKKRPVSARFFDARVETVATPFP